MKRSMRLLVFVGVCLLPALAVLLYSEANLRASRQAQAAEDAQRQVELTDADLIGVLGEVRSLAAALAALPEISHGGQSCSDRLAALQQGTPEFRFLILYSAARPAACSSAPVSDPAASHAPPAGEDFGIGRYSEGPGQDAAYLPISVRVPAAGGGAGPVTLLAGLDLRWLNRHLEDLGLSRIASANEGALFVTDRDGTVVARFPFAADWVGRKLPPALMPYVTKAGNGAADVLNLVASTPTTVPPGGMAVMAVIPRAGLAAAMGYATLRDLLWFALAVLAAIGVVALAASRFVYRPTENLLAAARRWHDGDLSARAEVRQPNSEIGALALAFNAMASSLQTRELERRLQAELLEAQVAGRTSELSELNNRLQVEIAEREKTEATLVQAQKLQAVGQLAGGIAHDFNNMLATVLGSLELMERRVAGSADAWTEADADRLRKLIERASNAVQRGAQLTSRLLAFSRRQRLAARPTDINELIADLVTLATSTLGRRIRVVTDLADDLPPAMVDPSQIEAALLNLCLNARDAMPEGGELTIRTASEALQHGTAPDDPPAGAYVRISVVDTGIGMTPEIAGRAFEPFFTTKGPGGTGLGLAQVYGMARQSGGTVRIDSTPGDGTEIMLFLPRAAADAEAKPADRAPDLPPRGSPSLLVLLVDDDIAVRQVTAEMLKDLGYDNLQAGSAAEAMVTLAQLAEPPDLVLLDYAMPGMNGLQLARRLRERGYATPIGMVTGYAELADSAGAHTPLDALLRKPFTIRELDATLMRLRRRMHAGANVVRLRPRASG